MLGQEELFTALNIESIKAVVDPYNDGCAIWMDRIIPADFSGLKSINCYITAEYNPNLEIDYYRYSASCRAQTSNESLTIAKAVIDGINRVWYSPGYFISCKLLPVIPPMDERDNYNSPVEILIKKR